MVWKGNVRWVKRPLGPGKESPHGFAPVVEIPDNPLDGLPVLVSPIPSSYEDKVLALKAFAEELGLKVEQIWGFQYGDGSFEMGTWADPVCDTHDGIVIKREG